MREEIRRLLVDGIKTIKGAWEPSVAGPKLEMPYLVLREGIQSPSDPYKDFTTVFEVWPYTERTTFKNVDNLQEEILSVLNKTRFDVDGVPHYIEFTSTISEDVVVDEWDALTRGLRFQVYSLAWLLHSEIEPDPVTGMIDWTNNKFPLFHTDPTKWNPQNGSPALYWRVGNVNSVQSMSWGAWLDVTLKGHLIIPSTKKRAGYLDKVVRQLALDKVTRLSDNSKMQFQNVSADSSYDPFGNGQLTLQTRFGILHKEIKSDQIKKVTADPKPGGVIS